jgi:hypothetical protein
VELRKEINPSKKALVVSGRREDPMTVAEKHVAARMRKNKSI